MVVLGLILVVMTVACAVGVLTGNGMSTPMEWYGLTLDGLPGWSSDLAGLLTMLVLVAGLFAAARHVTATWAVRMPHAPRCGAPVRRRAGRRR